MIIKLISEIYIGLSILVFLISYTSWNLKAKIRYPKIISLFVISGVILQAAYVLFSSFYCKPLSFYSEISRLINNLPSALCGFFIITAILCMEIPCTSRTAKKYAEITGKIQLNSMPSQIREIQRAETKNFISESQAVKKQEILHKKITFFEKMNRTAGIVFKYSLYSGIGLTTLNFLLVFGIRKFVKAYTLEKAFETAILISLWNQIVFSIPFFFISFGILRTCSIKSLYKADTDHKINKKLHLFKKKGKKLRIKKDKKENQQHENDETKTIRINLGYGLISLIDSKTDFILTKTVEKFRQNNPELPEISINDCAIYQTWEYHIEYGTKDIKDFLTGTETFDVMVKTIMNLLCETVYYELKSDT